MSFPTALPPSVGEAKIDVFPNPTQDFLYIRTDMFYDKRSIVFVAFDIVGDAISVKGFASGVYVLQFYEKNRLKAFKRFIVS